MLWYFLEGRGKGWEDGWWKGKDWQWEFHVIPFGMEGMLPGKSSLGINRETAAETGGNKDAASKHSEGRRKHIEQTDSQLKK